MNRVFNIPTPFPVPDGTLVSPFLNSKDSMSGLPFDLLAGFSIAAGTIEPRTKSRIHLHPFVTQVTFVRRGDLEVRMKGARDDHPYSLRLTIDEAVLTEAGTFFQLVNDSEAPCEVLYIVSPAYVFEMLPDGRVVYDDAVVIDGDYEHLDSAGWQSVPRMPTLEERRRAERRLATATGHPS